MNTKQHIAEIHQESIAAGSGKLNGKERDFMDTIHRSSLLPGFNGLTLKQKAWFNAIAKKLEATKGITAFQLISERHRGKFQRRRNSYYATCVGY